MTACVYAHVPESASVLVFLSCNFVNVYLLSIVVIVLTFACTCLHACVYIILNYPGYDSDHE